MLCLTRKVGEKIVIDDKIKIKVIDICSNKVRLGFEAPNNVRIDREEIWIQKLKGGTQTKD